MEIKPLFLDGPSHGDKVNKDPVDSLVARPADGLASVSPRSSVAHLEKELDNQVLKPLM